MEISSLCVVFVPLSVHLSARAAAGAGYPDFFFTNKCANSKKNTMHLSHPGCVHYPRSCCAKELEHWTSTVLYVLDATKTSQSSHSLLYIFLLSPAERAAYTRSHKQNKPHHLSQPAKNTQPRFLWERCPLPHTAQPKILPSTLQWPAGELLVLGFSRSHNERLSERQMSVCCLPQRRRWEPGSTFARPILHNVCE